MTVKRNGDRVVLKDGKVSCSCCGGPPGECCMYPAQALADGLYTADDLPDAITGGGGTNFTRSGTTFLGPPNSYDVVLDINESGFAQWASATNYANLPFFDVGFIGPECTSSCLITPEQDLGQFCYSYEDQFADTYTFAAAGMTPPSVVVTRRSLCRWDFFEEDPEGGGRYWILEYANDRRPDALWYFTIPSTFPGYKTGLQNSPVGTYTGSGMWTGTIS